MNYIMPRLLFPYRHHTKTTQVLSPLLVVGLGGGDEKS